VADGAKVAGDTVECQCADVRGIQPVIDALRARDVTVREVVELKSSLEEVFLRVVKSGEGDRS
jgi:hypothetical protein